MKKFICIALSALLLLASLSLSACSNTSTDSLEEKVTELETLIENQNDKIEEIKSELEKTNKLLDENYNDVVKLTADNYDNYISINLHFGDCFYINDDGSNSLYCTGYITTSPKTDCVFSNVSIQYQIEVVGWVVDTSRIDAELSYLGESRCSFFLHQNSTMIKVPDLYTISIKSVYGVALVHKLP